MPGRIITLGADALQTKLTKPVLCWVSCTSVRKKFALWYLNQKPATSDSTSNEKDQWPITFKNEQKKFECPNAPKGKQPKTRQNTGGVKTIENCLVRCLLVCDTLQPEEVYEDGSTEGEHGLVAQCSVTGNFSAVRTHALGLSGSCLRAEMTLGRETCICTITQLFPVSVNSAKFTAEIG